LVPAHRSLGIPNQLTTVTSFKKFGLLYKYRSLYIVKYFLQALPSNIGIVLALPSRREKYVPFVNGKKQKKREKGDRKG
jgi:hypothetical protein